MDDMGIFKGKIDIGKGNTLFKYFFSCQFNLIRHSKISIICSQNISKSENYFKKVVYKNIKSIPQLTMPQMFSSHPKALNALFYDRNEKTLL